MNQFMKVYSWPMTQIAMVGFVAFCLPGLYNTISVSGALLQTCKSVKTNNLSFLFHQGIGAAGKNFTPGSMHPL